MPDKIQGKILIVDDTRLGRLSVKKILSNMNLNNILECDSGNKVAEILKDEEIALILMDILMPGQNGVDTLKQIRKGGIDTPVVFITADIQESTREECEKAGSNGFVCKPVKEDKLRPVLEELNFL